MVKRVPKQLMSLKGMSQVVKVEALPPGTHRVGIKPEYTALVCYLANGEKRVYGVEKAWIGADLEMYITGFDPRFEELMSWPNGNPKCYVRIP